MTTIPIKELPERREFIGKPIKEHGVDVERRLARFIIDNGFLGIYVEDGGQEICIGGTDIAHASARFAEDGNLYISGAYCPTFVLSMND